MKLTIFLQDQEYSWPETEWYNQAYKITRSEIVKTQTKGAS